MYAVILKVKLNKENGRDTRSNEYRRGMRKKITTTKIMHSRNTNLQQNTSVFFTSYTLLIEQPKRQRDHRPTPNSRK